MTYSNVYKAGRCWNASHRDAGTIIHIVPGAETSGYWGTKSLCGTEPGKRSYGWASSKKEANCAKCIAKQEKINKEKSLENNNG